MSLLDFKLALRMLFRFPGLTLVGSLAIAFAIWVGAGGFELITQVTHPRLPLEEGDRVVAIQTVDRASARSRPPRLHDFEEWAGQVRTMEDLGAFRQQETNLIGEDGIGVPVAVAEISAAAFQVTRVPPLLGRHLSADDERRDADPVAVVGYDLWQGHFEGDPEIVGRAIRLGRTVHTVVGVMPEGYAFPVYHGLWVPLQLDPSAYAAGSSPPVRVFGRLGAGVSMKKAQAELAVIAERMAAVSPDTHEHLGVEVMPYARSIVQLPPAALLALGSANIFPLLLLVLVCSNVALLMFARAATRENELAVRSALGASRRRIIGQLFAEALVLAAAGGLLGLAGVDLALDWAFGALPQFDDQVPFWIRPKLSARTIMYAGLLVLVAASIAGVIPGMKVTRGLRARLQRASAGGGGFRFGGFWTAVIVSQIAITMAFQASVFLLHLDARELRAVELGFPDNAYLSVRLEMDREEPNHVSSHAADDVFATRYAQAVQHLTERLVVEPGVERVAFAERLPRMYHPHRLVEVDEGGAAPLHPSWPAYRVSSASVAPDYFAAFDAPILGGRAFHSGDLEPDGRTVIVNQSFVDDVLGGRNPIGRHLRPVHFEERILPPDAPPEPWYEIVGVVQDLGFSVTNANDPKVAGYYHPVVAGGVHPGHLALRVEGDPAAFAPTLRSIATNFEPDLRLYDVQPLEEANAGDLAFLSFWFRLSLAVSGIAVFLSLAGIYSVMAFTVTQRTREIGIRVALGGTAALVTRAILRRPLRQVGLGITIGALVSTLLLSPMEVIGLDLPTVALLLAHVAAMIAVCLIGGLVPVRRALGVEPTEVLKAD